MSQYTSFEPIDEAADAGLDGDPTDGTKAHQAQKKQLREPTSPHGSKARVIREGPPAQMTTQDTVARLQPTTMPQSPPYSKMSDPEFLGPRTAPLPRSATTVLPPKRTQHHPQRSSMAAYYDPDEVNRKVAAMLAATEALKPKSPAPSTKKETMKNRVLSKVAGLFGRRRSNKPGKDKRKRVKDTEAVMDPYSTKRRQPFSTEPQCVLGEDTETRAWTPQEPIEHRIPRKPLPNDALDLQTPCVGIGGPLPAPEAMGEETLCPYGVVNKADIGSFIGPHDGRNGKEDRDCGGSQTRIGDPFGSEQSFDNLEGFLTTQPIGSSTPKKRGSFNKDWTFDNSHFLDQFPPPGGLSYPPANDADDELTDDNDESSVSRKKQGKRRARPAIRLQHGSANVVLDVDDIEPKRMKKHPSPSKASLEELSRQFDTLPSPNNQAGLAMGRMGLSPIMAAFPYPPARIPASRTSSTAEYHAFMRANPQASSVPPSSTEKQLFTTEPPTRAPSRRAWQAGETGRVPRGLAGGNSSVHISQSRSTGLEELRRHDGDFDGVHGARGRPV